MMKRYWILACLLATTGATASFAQDWTRFRGPNGTGGSEVDTIPAEITADDYNWRVELPGYGHSSPVAWGERLFLMSADRDSAERHLLCINAETGEREWQKDFPSKSHHLHLRSSYASSSPAVDEEHVYFAWAEPTTTTLIAFDHLGNEVWQRDLGRFESQHGFGASPIVYKDLVIMLHSQQARQLRANQRPGQSRLLALDRKTGETIWDTDLNSTMVCYTVPCVYVDENGEEQLVGVNMGNGLFGVNPEDGELLWEVNVFEMRTVASTLVADGMIYGSNGSGGGGNYLVAVELGEQPTEKFRVTRSANYVPTPIAHEGKLFLFGDGGIGTCVDARTGEQHWQERLSEGFSGSPVRVKDLIYCIADSGDLVTIRASDRFEIVATHSLGEESRSTPAISNGRMYLRTVSHLISVGGE